MAKGGLVKGRGKVVSKGKKPPKSGVTGGSGKTERQKGLDKWPPKQK